MKHRRAASFVAAYNALPAAVQKAAITAFNLLKNNPSYPSLRFSRLTSNADYWEARVGRTYRAVAIKADPDTFIWIWIGSHEDFNQKLNKYKKGQT